MAATYVPAQRLGMAEAFSAGVPAEFTTFVKRTYGLLTFSLFLAAGACALTMKLMPVVEVTRGYETFRVPQFPMWGMWAFAGGGFVFSLVAGGAKAGARSGEASPLGLLALCAAVSCWGAFLAPVIKLYVGMGMAQTVALAGGVTAVTFTGLTLFVLVTGKDFSFLRNLLFVAILGLIVAGVAGFFVQSAQFHWWRAAIGSMIFCGFILFDTSNVVRVYGPGNLVVPAVISLFLDILNLFILLLQLFTPRRN